ncbi:DinB family protein [Allohahella marinimesophila]|uniref:DinB family protein n=1 Tax=Allohahella marinimesophila TaxID=1054972 RepID=A0ABP7PGI7_9GAMM
MKRHFELMANYNQWMNAKVYDAASKMSESEITKDRGAFFGSVLGTLNHIAVGDIIWLKRFATHPGSTKALQNVSDLPNPGSLDGMLFDNFRSLRRHRNWLDDQIIRWVSALEDKGLDCVLSYRNTKGIASDKRFSSLIMHFFNHQTHHRGQASVLLSQAGQDIGVTDLLALIPQDVAV